jgi:hypothetical protein
LLEPETRSGMLLHPRDWSLVERRDVFDHLRSQGWAVLPISQFIHLSSDGETVIRLLGRHPAPPVADVLLGQLLELPPPAAGSAPVEVSV